MSAAAIYICFHCRERSEDAFDECPKCGTFFSATKIDDGLRNGFKPVATRPKMRIKDHHPIMFSRFPTPAGNPWLRATGGGWVKGASYLVWSRGGCGKSREMLKEVARLGGIFVSIEMPIDLVIAVGYEIGAEDAHCVNAFGLAPEPAWHEIRAAAFDAPFVVVDSVTEIGNKETAAHMKALRPLTMATIVYIGQATKGGDHAGPAALAHEVDCEIQMFPRSLRTNKNRMGPRGRFPR